MQKGIYPYEYMDDWDKFSKISLPEKEDFYSHVIMDDIIDADYTCPKKICKDFEKKHRRVSSFDSIIVSWCIWKL